MALWQARHVQFLLEQIGLQAELKIIHTQGDQIQHLSLDKLEGKGFFTKEIEEALLNNETDIAVHSHKDLPTESPEGLVIAAIPEREDPSELILIQKDSVDKRQKFSLKKNAIVGTSSARRKAQLLAHRPDVTINDLRGNVPTRVNKLREKMYDAILVAAAGVERLELDLSDFHVEKPDLSEFISAPAQGALAIQIRSSDKELFAKLQAIHHPEVAALTNIERKVLELFHGGCHMPVGVSAELADDDETFRVRACKAVTSDDLPIYVYAESKQSEGLAERIVEKIQNIKPCRVFMTRDLNSDSMISRVLGGHGFTIEGKALIDTVPVEFGSAPDSDWIFFSSKQAVNYFFRQQPEPGNRKYACVGKPTADALRKFGKRADFIGGSTDTKLIGKQFAAKAGDDKILFPQAKGSLRSVQQQFVRSSQVIDLVVYETLKRNSGPQPEAEIILFTSPSNVDAWFERFKVNRQQQVIAMGDATGNTLRQHGIIMFSQPDAFDECALLRAIFNASERIKITE